MTTITLTIAPASFTPRIVNNDDIYQTTTGALQVASRAGSRWAFSLGFRRAGTDARTLRGQIASLQGMRNRLLVPLSKCGYVRGGAGGTTCTVSGNHTSGAVSVALAGLPSSTSNILFAGDYLTIGNQLVQATAVLSSSGTTGTVAIWPPLNQNRAGGVTVLLSAPTGLFIKTSDDGFTAEPMPSGNFWYAEYSVELIEDVLG